MDGNYGNVAPVKEGDILDVRIEALGEKGDGICRKNGFVLVVPNTKKDDRVRIKVTKVLTKVGFAQVVEVLSQPKEKVEDIDVQSIRDMERSSKSDSLPPPEDPIYTEEF